MKVRELKFVMPPENGGQMIQCAYAATSDAIVRRTQDMSDGTTVYQTADWHWLSGEFAPQNETPSVPFGAWQAVSADKDLP